MSSDLFGYDEDRSYKRTLSIRDKQILYRNAKGTCQNPACSRKIEFDEMQAGHKFKAWSKGGSTNIKNSVCLCWRCNIIARNRHLGNFSKKTRNKR